MGKRQQRARACNTPDLIPHIRCAHVRVADVRDKNDLRVADFPEGSLLCYSRIRGVNIQT